MSAGASDRFRHRLDDRVEQGTAGVELNDGAGQVCVSGNDVGLGGCRLLRAGEACVRPANRLQEIARAFLATGVRGRICAFCSVVWITPAAGSRMNAIGISARGEVWDPQP